MHKFSSTKTLLPYLHFNVNGRRLWWWRQQWRHATAARCRRAGQAIMVAGQGSGHAPR
jgi:hypothetical protein